MTWDATDLATLLDSDMPGYRLATLAGGVAIPGIFRAPYQSDLNSLVGDTAPSLTVASSQVPAVGDAITVDGVALTVDRIEPHPHGLTRIVLKTRSLAAFSLGFSSAFGT